MVRPNPTITRTLRRRYDLAGQVQGVGFRPFVYRLAQELNLTGHVLNRGDAVRIEAQGDAQTLHRFTDRLLHEHPALARIDLIEADDIAAASDESQFTIDVSEAPVAPTARIAVDAAVCPDCIVELLSDADRRHGYALINCTNCGPRYTIIRDVPYDRPNTTMAGFEMCADCRDEYTNPADRRFHAQPVACHACGPTLSLATPQGERIDGDPIRLATDMLRGGKVLLIKGIGGFHLAVRADDEAAVARLRRLKQRDAKPFALMVRSIEHARTLVRLSDDAAALMRSPRCPIVLASRRGGDARIAPSVAPHNARLGVMLPYTPIHHLLFAAWASDAAPPLVMTSANVSDEPLVKDNDEAVARLGGMCDAILWHDRPIERCVDDSVLLDATAGPPIPVRRARGYVPQPIALPIACDEPGLCVGGELKNTVAIVRDGEAILSHHLGDLKHPLAFEHFQRAIDDLCRLFDIQPRWVAHDLHPAYLSTQHARQLAERWGAALIPVQHHHAHAASLLAEHRLTQPILALTCDGVGHGDDGTSWGGELLLADAAGYQRLAHLRPLTLPGGDAAARDTRRCALALLHQAYGDDFTEHPAAVRLLPEIPERRVLGAMIRRGVNSSKSSALGRAFDGVAALLGLCEHNSFEAQAAMTLESVAQPPEAQQPLGVVVNPLRGGPPGAPGFEPSTDRQAPSVIDLGPTVRALVDGMTRGEPVEQLAALFHENLAQLLAAAVRHAAQHTGITTVGLTGGVFCNQWLTDRLTALLERPTTAGAHPSGFDPAPLRVLRHAHVPPTDGGLALGQALVASATQKGAHPCA